LFVRDEARLRAIRFAVALGVDVGFFDRVFGVAELFADLHPSFAAPLGWLRCFHFEGFPT
jgi:hypothetical protein